MTSCISRRYMEVLYIEGLNKNCILLKSSLCLLKHYSVESVRSGGNSFTTLGPWHQTGVSGQLHAPILELPHSWQLLESPAHQKQMLRRDWHTPSVRALYCTALYRRREGMKSACFYLGLRLKRWTWGYTFLYNVGIHRTTRQYVPEHNSPYPHRTRSTRLCHIWQYLRNTHTANT
jgi:hypothetical protein